jgi:hypothetical protein
MTGIDGAFPLPRIVAAPGLAKSMAASEPLVFIASFCCIHEKSGR